MNAIDQQNLNIIISIVSTIVAALIAWSAWQRRHTPGARWFIGLVLCVAWITFWYIFEAAAGFDVDAYVTFGKLEYVGLTYIPLFWFGFSLSYSGSNRPMSKGLFWALRIIPLVTIALAWTNEFHGLIWRETVLVDRGGLPIFEPAYGTWFWVNAILSYSVFAAGSVVLVRLVLDP